MDLRNDNNLSQKRGYWKYTLVYSNIIFYSEGKEGAKAKKRKVAKKQAKPEPESSDTESNNESQNDSDESQELI